MVVMKEGERVLFQTGAKYEHGKGFRVPTGTNGTLFVTNKRILFEYSQGLISKSTFLGVQQPVDTITNVTTQGMIGKKLVIEFNPTGDQKIIGNPMVVLSVGQINSCVQVLQSVIAHTEV